MKFPKSWYFFFCTIFFSCSQVLDFEQVQAYELNASYTVPLVYFEVALANFLKTEQVIEKSDVKFLNSFFIKENLSKIELKFEVINELNRDVNIQILLLDNEDSLLYSLETLKIAAKNLEYQYQEVVDIAVHQEVKNLAGIKILINLEGPIVVNDISDTPVLRFKSGLTIHFGTAL